MATRKYFGHTLHSDGYILSPNGRKLKPIINPQYQKVQVRIEMGGGTRSMKSLARLILEAFVRKPNKSERPFYKDGDFENCSLENLEWETYQRFGRRVEKQKASINGRLTQAEIIRRCAMREQKERKKEVVKERKRDQEAIENGTFVTKLRPKGCESYESPAFGDLKKEKIAPKRTIDLTKQWRM